MAEPARIFDMILEALDEPALLVASGVVRLANEPARALLGAGIEGNDIFHGDLARARP